MAIFTLERKWKNDSNIKCRCSGRQAALVSINGSAQFPREYQFGEIYSRGGTIRIFELSNDALPPRVPSTGQRDARGSTAWFLRACSAPVTPPSSILFDYSMMGEKKASERAKRAGRRGRDETRQKGGTRWVVINGEAIWFLLGDVLFALCGGLRRHNEQAPVLMNLHSFVRVSQSFSTYQLELPEHYLRCPARRALSQL